MTDYYAQVILILRENGVRDLGNVGKEILAHMILAKIENPSASYKQICWIVEGKDVIKHLDTKWQKGYIICNHDGMSDMECSVLYLIEGLESHKYEDDGRNVIAEYIERMYIEFKKSLHYEEILEKVKSLGLKQDNDGVNLMITMAYKYRLNPKISENDMYDYLMEKCNPSSVINAIKEARDTPVEIVGGSNLHQIRPREATDIIKEEIDSLIFEAAKKTDVLSQKKTVKEIIDVILE